MTLQAEGREAVFVNTTGKLKSVNYNYVDRLLGIFANSHLPYDHERDTSNDGQPRSVGVSFIGMTQLNKAMDYRFGSWFEVSLHPLY